MKIAVIFDSQIQGGGGYYQSLNSALLLNKLNNDSNNFFFITTNKKTFSELKQHKLNLIHFKKLFITKIFYHLSQNNFFCFLLNFFGFKNPFSKFLNKYKFNLVIFLGPSWLIKNCDLNFISTIYDINFKLDNFFPEYKSSTIFNSKDIIVKKSVNHAFKIIVDTERSKNELINIYSCSEKKIVVQPFIPLMPSIDKNIINKNEENIINKNNLNNKNYLFYPAQFWAHKNHKYIIDALEILKNKNIDINVVFCGSDKGNLKYINNIISKKNLKNTIHIVNFISEQDLVLLYKNCLALVMPTYVARSTLPLYEAFYFKKPILYSKNVLDEKLEKLVNTLDLNDPNDLALKIQKIILNELQVKEKIEDAYSYFSENCSEILFNKNYKKILNDYKYQSERWE